MQPSSMIGNAIEIEFFSRLHFGLMEICPGQPHCYGGVGIMVDVPASRVAATLGVAAPGEIVLSAEAYWADRIQSTLRRWLDHGQHAAFPVRELRVACAPRAHVGLGSGTQFACSIAALLQIARGWQASGTSDGVVRPGAVQAWFPNASAMSGATGRGRRSFIGLQGFLRGGLIVDTGLQPDAQSVVPEADRTTSSAFPDTWRFLLWCDDSYRGDSGEDEAAMFARCAQSPNPHRNDMLQCIHEQLLPSIAAEDWPSAGNALGRYGAMAGEIFLPMQGGTYRSAAIAQTVAAIESFGIPGAGQSSWGPTVYALTRDPEQAQWLAQRLRERFGGRGWMEIARVAGPAQVHVSGDSGSSGRE